MVVCTVSTPPSTNVVVLSQKTEVDSAEKAYIEFLV